MRFRIINHTYPAEGTILASDLALATLNFAAGLQPQPETEVKWVPGLVWGYGIAGAHKGRVTEHWTVEEYDERT